MENIAQINLKKCEYHPQITSKYLYINKNEQTLIPVCSICTKIKEFKHEQLILNEECFSNDQNNIITNWPPLEDQKLEIRLFKCLIDSQFSNQLIEKREKYFQKVKNDILEAINKIQKLNLKYNFNDIMEVYNQISQKEQLKQYLLDELDNQEIKKQIKDIICNAPNNKKLVERSLLKYEQLQQISDQSSLELLFTSFLSQIEYFINKSNEQQTDFSYEQLLKQIQQVENIKNDQIKSIINLYNQQQTNLMRVEDVLQISEQQIKKINQNLSKFQQIQLEQIKKFQQTFESCLNQVDIKDVITSNQVNLFQDKLFYYDYPIKISDLNKKFKFQIIQSQDWVGVGIVNLTDQASTKQIFAPSLDKNFYFYQISKNGYSWNQEDKDQNQKQKSFQFKQGDIIQVKINENQIKFKKNGSNEKFKMKFSFHQNKVYSLFYWKNEQSDQIQLIE